MRHLIPVLGLGVVVAAAGCGSNAPYRPDGGRQCTTEFNYVPVKVVDASGQPVEGATVTARNPTLNRTSTGTTNSQGVTTAIGEDLGEGTVTVSGVAGTRSTDTKQIAFSCGECHCTGQPSSITLTLQ